jgi:hypothetical protein
LSKKGKLDYEDNFSPDETQAEAEPANRHDRNQLKLMGLGNPRTVRFLRRLVKETMLSQKHVEKIRLSLRFDCCFAVDCVGKSGGLILLWNSSCLVNIQNFSKTLINAVV